MSSEYLYAKKNLYNYYFRHRTRLAHFTPEPGVVVDVYRYYNPKAKAGYSDRYIAFKTTMFNADDCVYDFKTISHMSEPIRTFGYVSFGKISAKFSTAELQYLLKCLT